MRSTAAHFQARLGKGFFVVPDLRSGTAGGDSVPPCTPWARLPAVGVPPARFARGRPAPAAPGLSTPKVISVKRPDKPGFVS